MGQLDKWAKSFASSCLRKKSYRTSEKAQKVANKVFAERGVKLYCYWCKECGLFHLTSRPPRNTKESRERCF